MSQVEVHHCCPTCGVRLKRDHAVWSRKAQTFSANGRTVILTFREAALFDVLWSSRHKGGIGDRDKLFDKMFEGEINGGPLSSNVKSVYMARVRKRIAPTGYTITRSYGQARRAYRLVEIKDAQ